MPIYTQTGLLKITQAELTPKESHILFLFDKSRMAQNFLDGNQTYSFAYQSCPTCPPSSHLRQGTYLFYPLHDSQKEHSGFAGVLLNEGFVRDGVIVRSIVEAAPSHTSSTAPLAIAITISDESDRVLYSNGPAQDGHFSRKQF